MHKYQSISKHLARKSLKEEKKAVEDYDKREEKTPDKELKGKFKHAEKEEKEHAKSFKSYVDKDKDKDKEKDEDKDED